MYKTFTLSASAALISCLFLITGCSSSDDGGTTTTASVPANATVIDATNAETMVATISSSLRTFDQALAVETTPVIGLNAALEIIEPFLKNHSSNSGANLATGITESEVCPGGGTFTDTFAETTDGDTFSVSGTISFVNCGVILDPQTSFVINGSLTYNESENNVTGAYTDSATGSISIALVTSTDTVTISLTGINFQESGNNIDLTYTTTQSAFALVVVFNGTTEIAILATLSAPIVESNNDITCPESGHITITGGNNTTAEGIYNGDGTMTIKANGVVVKTNATCYI